MLKLAIGLCLTYFLSSLVAAPTPLTIKDVSLMLRSGYSSEAVLQELSRRKFADTLDSSGEKMLVQAGASQSLISSLQSGVYQLSPTEVAASKLRQKSDTHERQIGASISGQTPNKEIAPTPSAHETQIGGSMYDHLKDDLVYWHEGSLAPFDNEVLERKKFFLLFFSAIWSKEGRQFTEQLVNYYNRVHPQHPEFEVVFFSADRSQFAMENYVSQTHMPWPALAYDKRDGKAGAIATNLVRGIPSLILSDAGGKILSQTGENSPPDKVLAELDKVLSAAGR